VQKEWVNLTPLSLIAKFLALDIDFKKYHSPSINVNNALFALKKLDIGAK
jgi:hypothetical protein